MMNEKKKRPLLILTGPTAVGKTELSIALAKKINGAVISADSMQVYRGMDIGSACFDKSFHSCLLFRSASLKSVRIERSESVIGTYGWSG